MDSLDSLLDSTPLKIKLTTHFVDSNHTYTPKKWCWELPKSCSIGTAFQPVMEQYTQSEQWEVWVDGWLVWCASDGMEVSISELWMKCNGGTNWQLYDIGSNVYKKMVQEIDKKLEHFERLPHAPRMATFMHPLCVKVVFNGHTIDARLYDHSYSQINIQAVAKWKIAEKVDHRMVCYIGTPMSYIPKAKFQIGSKDYEFPFLVSDCKNDDMLLCKDFLTHFEALIDFSKMELNLKDHPDGPIPLYAKFPVESVGLLYRKQANMSVDEQKINTLPLATKLEVAPYIREVTDPAEEELAKLHWKTDRMDAWNWKGCRIA